MAISFGTQLPNSTLKFRSVAHCWMIGVPSKHKIYLLQDPSNGLNTISPMGQSAIGSVTVEIVVVDVVGG